MLVDYSKDAGKLGRHNLGFKTGAFKNRRNDKRHDRRQARSTLRRGEW